MTLSLDSARGAEEKTNSAPAKTTLKALFIGNSYTARHNLAKVVKAMAEAGNPGLTFEPTTIIYGGRTLKDHWRLGSQNFVKSTTVAPEEIKATIAALEQDTAKDPQDNHGRTAIGRQKELLGNLESRRVKWDVVILQSYRDDLAGAASLYAEYAPKFASLAHAQGARVVLYVTTPTTQNAELITTPPAPAAALEMARATAQLADQVGADAAPMALVAQRCQTERPDLTLRYVNDGHLNQNLAYLSACTLYAALFHKSPQGLPINSVTDTRFFEQEPGNRTKDPDGHPITRTFSDKDRADLQRIAWESYQEFQKMRSK